MSKSIQVFSYESRHVRTVLINGEPWFVARDVAEILDLADARQAVDRLDEDERCLIPVTDSLGRQQETFVVNEPGLYTLVLGSRKPEAKAFKRWITHEVIPSIRKTGTYSVQQLGQQLGLEDLIIMQAQSVKELKGRVAALEERAAAAHHRIDNLDSVNPAGDLQQKLNAMVRKFAQQAGITYPQAWREFKQAFNTAYRANLELRMEHFKVQNRLKKPPSLPEYLSHAGLLEDAIRVADKLLNRAG